MATVNTALSRFRRMAEADKRCKISSSAHFIKNHVSSTIIKVVKNHKQTDAVLLFGNEEGADNIYVYTYADENLKVGDYFIWKKKWFLVYEDINIVREVGFKKQRAVECNAETTSNIHIAYLGSLRTYKDSRLAKIYLESGLKPAIVVGAGLIEIGSRIIVGGYEWEVVDGDTISIPGVDYLYVNRRTKATEVVEEVVDDENAESIVVYAGSTLTFNCDNGVFTADKTLKVTARTMNSATVLVPFGIESFTINAKVDDEPVVLSYEVRGG